MISHASVVGRAGVLFHMGTAGPACSSSWWLEGSRRAHQFPSMWSPVLHVAFLTTWSLLPIEELGFPSCVVARF